MPAFALEGLRVLSVGHTLPGMYCMAVLRDLGADVTRVERLSGTPGAQRHPALAGLFPTRSLMSGTSVCELDLKTPRGQRCFLRLARQADVVLEGFRPGVAARLGIGYETLAQAQPRLVYAAISGYGQEGPGSDRVGHDINYLASAGVLSLTGDPAGSPAFPGVTVGDGMAGINAALNILAALRVAEKTGRGAFLDIAITDGPLFLMSMEFERAWETGESRGRGSTHLSGRYPWYHLFETRDGRYLSIGAVEPAFYQRLCTLLGRPDLAGQQFASGTDLEELFQFFEETFKSRTQDEWALLLAGQETCVAPVLTPGEAAEAPQNQRAFVRPAGPATPLVRSPVRLPSAPAQPGRDTAQTLTFYGFSQREIHALQRSRVAGS